MGIRSVRRTALITASPSTSGSMMSRMTRAGASRLIAASAVRPSCASITRKPSRSRYIRTSRRIFASSSTTRIGAVVAAGMPPIVSVEIRLARNTRPCSLCAQLGCAELDREGLAPDDDASDAADVHARRDRVVERAVRGLESAKLDGALGIAVGIEREVHEKIRAVAYREVLDANAE